MCPQASGAYKDLWDKKAVQYKFTEGGSLKERSSAMSAS